MKGVIGSTVQSSDSFIAALENCIEKSVMTPPKRLNSRNAVPVKSIGEKITDLNFKRGWQTFFSRRLIRWSLKVVLATLYLAAVPGTWAESLAEGTTGSPSTEQMIEQLRRHPPQHWAAAAAFEIGKSRPRPSRPCRCRSSLISTLRRYARRVRMP